jgi:hypothetical protein
MPLGDMGKWYISLSCTISSVDYALFEVAQKVIQC